MKASYRWICELLPDLRASEAEVARRLTSAGLEIEGQEVFGAGLEALVVARVEQIEPHPSKSGLRLVTIDRGGVSQRVVCGAPNVPDPGGLVVLAPLGARLPAIDVTIAPRAIGGVTSEGMLCSEREMGIGEGGDGILVLREGKPGQPLTEALPSAQDTIFEVNVTPNRPDALGHAGIARELGVLFGLPPLSPPSPVSPERAAAGEAPRVELRIDEPERCPEYGAALVEGVGVGPSPLWLQHRLQSLGVRPINNIVDATNLVSLELGQPTHAFDADRVRGGKIIVRRAQPGEALTTLDGKAHELDADDLVIADGEGAVALAGVMGGASSEISPGTTRVLLECAYFEARGVRRSSRRHGIHTEASHRFERGVNREGVKAAMARLVGLLLELSPGARLSYGPHHVEPRPFVAAEIPLRSARLDALLGDRVPFDEALSILEKLGCQVAERRGDEARLRAPGWRPDLGREADLIEEVGRVRGFDRIEAVLPSLLAQPQPRVILDAELRRAAVELGLSEAVTYAFLAPSQLAALGAPEAAVRLKNPLSEERSVLRTSLLPGLLEALQRARRHGERSARLFTLGRLFFPADPSRGADAALPVERRALAALLAGPRLAHLAKPEDHDAFDAKAAAVELVFRALRRPVEVDAIEETGRPAHLHPRAAARLFVRLSADDRRAVGSFGLLHPDVLGRFEITGAVAVVELDIDALDALGRATPRVAPIPRLPAVSRDMAIEAPDEYTAGRIEKLILEAAGDVCERVELFDHYRDDAMASRGVRSLAFRVTYRDPLDAAGKDGARTLTDAEVDALHTKVKAHLTDRSSKALLFR